MKITYLYHSGFFVELTSCCLLFDYSKGDIPKVDKPYYVFVSHAHDDHFNPDIFTQTATFILSDDIKTSYTNYYEVKANQSYTIDDLNITTLKSTDEGVAFFVEVENKAIYHAGDLNIWHWEGEANWDNEEQATLYHQYLEPIKKKHIDVAFVVLDSRLEKQYYLGMQYFIENVDAACIFPMHMWDEYSIVEKYLQAYPTNTLVKVVKEQERFEVSI